MISWLPVTIDAAGTSNGVRVTGYAIYADGQKVWLGGLQLIKPKGQHVGPSFLCLVRSLSSWPGRDVQSWPLGTVQ